MSDALLSSTISIASFFTSPKAKRKEEEEKDGKAQNNLMGNRKKELLHFHVFRVWGFEWKKKGRG